MGNENLEIIKDQLLEMNEALIHFPMQMQVLEYHYHMPWTEMNWSILWMIQKSSNGTLLCWHKVVALSFLAC